MARVVMFVLGDVRFDARVRREAATLVQAGHQVTIIGRPANLRATVPEHDRDGAIEILRVPVPGRLRRLLLGAPVPWIGRRPPARLRGRGEATLAGPVRPARSAVDGVAGRIRSVAGGLAWLIRLRLGAFAWARAAATSAPAAEIWHGHDLPGLVAAAAARRRHGGRLVYDAHEVYVEAGASAGEPSWAKRVVQLRERRLAGTADAIVTVNEALAGELRDRLLELPGVSAPAAASEKPVREARARRHPPIIVIHNCPPFAPLDPLPGGAVGPLRAAAGVNADTPIALYHGSLARFRGTEVLLAALLEPGLEGVHAAFLGFGPLEPVIRTAALERRFGDRVHLLPPVAPEDLEAWIAGADVGVMPIAPSTLNHRLSTPNKLFECLAAGVPVVASDFPAIRAIVCDDPEGPLGRVCDPTSVTAVAAAVRELLDADPVDRAALRERCRRAARERWSWQHESVRLVELYAGLAAPDGSAGAGVRPG